jgi:hypothetical protein
MALVLNGDGNVTGLTPGGLPDASITQADLASGVAGNGPAFMAYDNTPQTISHNTNTKVVFGIEQFDTNSCYDISTSRFTPNVAGYYRISSFMSGAFIATRDQAWTMMVYKNASQYGPGTTNNVVTDRNSIDWGGMGVSCEQLVYMNGTTDYIEIYCYQYDYTSQTSKACNEKTFLAYMVRAA